MSIDDIRRQMCRSSVSVWWQSETVARAVPDPVPEAAAAGARRLLLSGAWSAEAIAYEVGYASASQFSREYARIFGQPPRRDAGESGNVFRY